MNEITPRRRRRKRDQSSQTHAALPDCVTELLENYPGVTVAPTGHILGGDDYVFVGLEFDSDASFPKELPFIVAEDRTKIFLIVPSDHAIHEALEDRTKPVLDVGDLGQQPKCYDPCEEKWPDDDWITEILLGILSNVSDVKMTRRCRSVLENACSPNSKLFAGRSPIASETPMLIDGFMSDGGVAVVYGAFDEFKTTIVMDMLMHVALGLPWQGREVFARPVIWYALERADEAEIRVKALQQQLSKKDTAWGEFDAPITVLDRIPENYLEWRAEVVAIGEQFYEVYAARELLGELPMVRQADTNGNDHEMPRYPDLCLFEPVVVIDTFSQWLGGEDEKGPKAVSRVADALDLLKKREDLAAPILRDDVRRWKEDNPNLVTGMDERGASQVVIIHHTTKTGDDFAGHRAIAADTQSLYRVRRFGSLKDTDRSMAGVVTPIRTKDMPKPAPLRFEAEIVPVENTSRTTAILRTRGPEIPKNVLPVLEMLRQFGDQAEINNDEIIECVDEVANNRASRGRYRKKLIDLGVLEPVEDSDGKVLSYRFHDPK